MDTDKYKNLKKEREKRKEELVKFEDRHRELLKKRTPIWGLLKKKKYAISKAKIAISKTESKEKKKEYEDIISECERIINKCEHTILPIDREMKKTNYQMLEKSEEISKIESKINKYLGL